MPKLTKQFAAQATAEADSWEPRDLSEPLDPGWYLFKLLEVEQKEGKNGPYWNWRYEEVTSGTWVWDATSLSEKAIGRLGKVFAAYEVPADTDTDELIGMLVNMQVGTKTIPSGARAGQLSNTVIDLAPGHTHPDFEEHAADKAQPKADDFKKPTKPKGRGAATPPNDEEPF